MASSSSTDGPSVDWKPQGGGPHPTLAGNRFDPNVGADGVHNTSDSSVHSEGIDHIKQNIGQSNTSGTDSSLVHGQPSSGTSGYDSATGGLSSGTGALGDSSTLGSSTTTDAPQNQGGIIGTVKSYLGLGGNPAESGEARDASYGTSSGSGLGESAGTTGGLTGATSGSGLTGDSSSGLTGGPSSGLTGGSGSGSTGGSGSGLTGGSTTDDYSRGVSGGNSAGTTSTTHDSTIDRNDPTKQSAPSTLPRDSDVTTGGDPTESADPTTAAGAKPGESFDEEGSGVASNRDKAVSDADAAKRTNESAIPTAGGERLGEKHWGESKVVAENPKPTEEKGVSSASGQPTDEVRNNTSANTGGAHPPGSGSTDDAGKEKLVDKIKDKLHLGHK